MLHLLKKVNKRVGGLYRGDKVATSGQYINSEMITCEQKVDEYLPGYTLYCSTYEENCEAKLAEMYSDAPLAMLNMSMGVESCLHLAKMFRLMMGVGERIITVLFCLDVLEAGVLCKPFISHPSSFVA